MGSDKVIVQVQRLDKLPVLAVEVNGVFFVNNATHGDAGALAEKAEFAVDDDVLFVNPANVVSVLIKGNDS